MAKLEVLPGEGGTSDCIAPVPRLLIRGERGRRKSLAQVKQVLAFRSMRRAIRKAECDTLRLCRRQAQQSEPIGAALHNRTVEQVLGPR